jgi:hypothetical protein
MQGQRKGFPYVFIIANMIAIGREELGTQSNNKGGSLALKEYICWNFNQLLLYFVLRV